MGYKYRHKLVLYKGSNIARMMNALHLARCLVWAVVAVNVLVVQATPEVSADTHPIIPVEGSYGRLSLSCERAKGQL